MNALKTLWTCVSIAAAFAIASPALAQAWPDKPIRVVVPYPPGGGVDFVSRAVAQRLGDVLKTTLVIDNRGGASGTIGADIVAKSAPDGYTFLVASPAEVVVGPIVGQKVNYDPARDLVPVTLIGETPLVIAAHPSLPAKTLPEFLALAKASPGKYSYGTPGTGSSMQFAGESLNALAGISVVHVPYRGAAPVVTDLLGGQVPVGIVGMPPTVPHAKSGKLRILAVTSEKRSSAMPDVPAVAELPGMKGYRFTNWMGVYVPAKTPQPVIDRLAAEIAKIVREPAMREKLLSQGVEPVGDTTAEFAAFLKAEFDTYSKIAKDRNIRATE
ncbi:MAG: Bug family tripartite tricarboxylate transporter substrate binding protein [Burkholderiales bacterium]